MKIKEYEKVLEIVNNQLGNLLTRESERSRMVEIAQQVYREYSHGGENSILQRIDCAKEVRAFEQMRQLALFFNHYQSNPPNLAEALNIQMQLGIIPFQPNQIDVKVKEFSYLDDCVRRNFTDILLATMDTISQLFHQSNKLNEKQQLHLSSRCVATFVGMIPYRLSGSANRSLIQLHAKMN